MTLGIENTQVSLPSELSEALKIAIETAQEAGALLRNALYQGASISDIEANGEVHALADLKAERLIRSKLMSSFPQWGMRSEEEPELNRPPQDELMRFWLVDPNDGTSAFVKGERGASVSIALIEKGRPVLGVIYAYMGLDDEGDLFTWAQGCGPLKRNGQAIEPHLLWAKKWEESTVFVSNSADEIADAYHRSLLGARFRTAPGVAYRLALVAAGEGDLATSLAGPRDFDYAAGHALLLGAGGMFVDERGREVRYHPQRPERLGFGFGGAPQQISQLEKLNWHAVLKREGKQSVRLRPPKHQDLCRNSMLLRLALSAWWGWHLGWALTAPKLKELKLWTRLLTQHPLSQKDMIDLEIQVAQVGGDQGLTKRLRDALDADHVTTDGLANHPLKALLSKLIDHSFEQDFLVQEIEELTEETTSFQSQLSFQFACLGIHMIHSPHSPHSPHNTSIRTGCHSWHPRLIGALLSYRQNEMTDWGSDSARLLEAWLTRLQSSVPKLEGTI